MLFKKIATILFLTFLFFNWVGYWLFISWYEGSETARMEARLDHDQYNTSQLIVFKVPADAIPYSNTSSGFQRTDGELQVGNIHYRYVRKRLYNDSIEFLCIPDAETGRLEKTRNDALGLVTGVPDDHGRTSPAGKGSLVLLKAFREQVTAFAICHFAARAVKPALRQETGLFGGYIRIGKQPPRLPSTLSA